MKFLNIPVLARLFISISLLFCFSNYAYSFQYEPKPYEIKVDGQLQRFIANYEDHSSLNFTNLEEGEIYFISYMTTPDMPEVFLHKTNVEIIEQTSQELKFVAQKNNTFHFNWYYPTRLSEFIISLVPVKINAQNSQPQTKSSTSMTITSGVSGSVMVDSLINGSCFQVFDISTKNGSNPNQYGTFSGGLNGIGIDKGIVLTSGNVNSIPGTNTTHGDVSTYYDNAGDIDLDTMSGTNTKDAATLEFTFVPTVDTVQFKFVWASEEYCIYSSSPFTDVAGFFVSGPGIVGTFSDTFKNFAISPITGDPMNVKFYNHFNHTFPDYVSNSTQAINDMYDPWGTCAGPPPHPVGSPSTLTECKFNAWSGVFDAIIPVIPCSTYYIKIAVADGTDPFYDSGFFIQGNSWDQGEPVTVEAINADDLSNEGYEGCGTYYYEFCKDPATPISEEYTVNFSFNSSSSTATSSGPAPDFDPLPTSVVIPSGVQCVQVPIVVNADSDNSEGQETIVIDVDDPCNCSSSEVTFFINDLVPITSNTPDQEVCGSGTLDLVVNPTGGAPPYTYNWNTGQTTSTINVGSGTYIVTITDDCGQTTSESINVSSLVEPNATISGGGSICPNSGATVPIEINFTGSGPWDFTYQQTGSVPVQITGNTTNPYIIQGDTIGSWFLTELIDPINGCPTTWGGSAVISEGSITINETSIDPLCNGTTSGSISLTPAGGSGSYSYTWSNGGTTATISNLPAGTYSVTVNDNNSVCEGIETYTLTEPPAITASFGSTPFIDCNNPTGTISVTAGGGSGTSYGYSWTTTSPEGSVVSGASSSTVTVGGPGTYDVQITDSNSCQDSFSVLVSGDLSDPTAATATPIDLDCTITSTQLDGTLSSSPATGTGLTYFWTTSNGTISDATSSMPTVTQGTYLLEVTEISNGCTDTVSVTVNNVGALPTLIINTPNQIDCTNSTEQLDASGSSNGPDISISWSPAGNITAGATTLTPTVNAGGTYTLTLEDSSNGCIDSLSVFVPDDLIDPTVDVGTNTMIDCNNASITLGGPTTSTGANFTQTWTDSAGNIISSNPTVDVTIQDTYTLTVYNSNNGCSDMQSISVTQDTISPTVFAAPAGPSIIDCINAVVTITGAGSSVPPNITYQWNTPDGNIFGSAALIDVDVNAEGSYNLTVTNTLNGCASTSSNVVIGQDTISPLANAGSTAEITCDSATITLNGTGSSGPDITYLWTTNTGLIVSGSTTLNPVVSQAGTYNLTVTDNSNGCDAMSSVVITSSQNLPIVSIIDPSDITCLTTSVLLDASGSSDGLTYSWQDSSDVVISTSDTVTVSSGGTYTFSVTDSGTGCTSTDSVTVDVNIILPIVQFATPQDITCSVASVDIDGTNSSGGDQYTWTTNDGTINSGANSSTVNVGSEGTYTLTLINPATGCQDSSSIDVVSDTISPIAVASTMDSITCINNQVMLDGNGSSQGQDFNYLWTTIDGQIQLGETTLTPFVTAGGTYDLLVTDSSNGCDAEASVFVFSDTIVPLADAGLDTAITCSYPSIELDGTGSDIGPDLTYLWTTDNGNISSGSNTLNPEVDIFGTYLLTVTNNANGCIDTSSVFVSQNNIVPISDAGVAEDLNCENTTITLNGTGSSGPDITYLWITDTGVIVSDETTLNPVVSQAGTYNLTVTDNSNGCSDTSSVIVSIFDNQPIASVSTPFLITCTDPIVLLDGSMSSQGPNISYLWTTNDGNIVASTSLDTANVDLSGTYTLIVTDDQSLCKDSTSIIVSGNSDVPLASGLSSGDWDCSGNLIGLSGSSDISNVSWQWSTLDGNIVSPITSQQSVEADTSGIYILAVMNNTNSCIGYDTVFVQDLVVIPSVTINDPGPINCSNPTVDISLDVTNMIGTDTTFFWDTTDGSIISSNTESTITVDSAGTYEVIVTNQYNFCSTDASITIAENSVYPTAVAGPTGEITCLLPEYTLDGAGTSTGTNYLYQWTTTNGNIVSGDTTLTPIIDLAGSYILSVTDTSSLCESLDSVSVTSNQSLPNVEAGPSQELNCTATEVTLAGSTTNTGPDYIYLWSTANGNIVSGETTLTPLVDASGLYVLSITDQINGCIGTDSVDVTVDANTPNADAGPGMVLDCSISSIMLDGTGSSSGTDFTYLWTTIDGNIVSDETTTTPTIDAGGIYTIEVTSTVNGCAFTSNVTVTTDTIVPDANAAFSGIIDCNTPTLTLSGAGSSTGTDYTYLWSTINGTIDSGANTLDPVVSMGGTYTLSVLDTTNTCTDSISLVIPEDTNIPLSVAGDTMEITCTNPVVILMGDNSDTGPDLVYQWTTSTGNIVSGGTTLNPEVDGGGVYILTVSNSVNGCFSEDSTLVNVDANLPIADAGASLILDCVNPSAQLDGNASSSGTNIEYLWTTATGNIVSGETTTTPTVDAGGTYSLQVTDTSNGCVINSSVDVTDNTQLPTATASATGIVDCNTPTLTVSGAGSSTGAEYTYQWTTINGTIDSGDTTLNPIVSQGGTYTLTIIDTTSSCEQFTDIVISENTTIPLSEAGDSSIITCILPQVVLDGSTSDTGTDFTYLWTSSVGNIVTDPTASIIEVDAAGVYTLTVTNIVNGCIAEDSTSVELDANVPTADAGSDLTLDCDNPTQQLDGSSSSSGTTIQYLWTTPNGNIVSGETTTTPTVDAAGTYSLQVTDSSNGCVINSDVIVLDDTDIPLATANFTGIVDCTTPTVAISGTGSSTGTEYTYEWTTLNGTIDSGANTLNPVVSQGGVYDLLIIDTLSNCQNSTSVTIPEDSTLPTVDVGPDSALDCATPTMTVDGSNSSSGTEFTYLWTTLNGNINGPADGTSIEIDSGGVYVLTVSNTVNGCVDSASVSVSQDFILPQVSTDPGGEINCTVLTIPLVGQATGNTANFIYNWQFFGGGSVSAGQGTLNAEASQADMYYLVVTDTINNCTAQDSVLVTVDANVPTISIANIDTLDCSLNSLVIDATGSTQDTDIIFNWIAINGQFDSGTNTLTPTVSTAGTYELVLNDTVSNCVTTSQFNVEQDTLAPGITLSSSALIDCFNPSISIDATIVSSGNVDAVWTAGTGGVIDGTNTGLSINVSSASTYDLQITDLSNGCLNTETIAVSDDLDNPILSAVAPDSISCPAPTVTLSATADTGGDPYTISWTTTGSGSLDSDETTLTPTVSGAAPYTLTVQNSVNGCIDSLTVDVFGDLDLPAVVAQVTDSLDCNILLVDIDGVGSSSSGTFDYTWSTSNGNIVSGQSSLLVQVDQPGDYTLVVQDLSNACEDSVTVAVTQNIIDPSITLSSSSIVNCYTPVISIDATVTSNGAFNSQWTATSGGTINGANTNLTVDVSSAGTYEILVTDSSNGCSSLESINVMEETDNPILAAALPDSISCPQPIVNLAATVDTGGEPFDFSWSTNSSGNINSGANTLNPSVSLAAPYTLTAQNNTNGCIDSLVVDVFGNLDLPAVNAQVADFLSCSNTTVDIDGTGSASSGSYNYSWSTNLGNIITGQGTLLIQVDQPGDYILAVEDLSNSCVDSVTVTVDQNIVAPVTAIALPDTLTCGITSVDLFGDAGPNPAPTYLYTWSTMNGNITSSVDAIDANTDQAGTYTLQILDSFNGCLSESSVDVIQDITLPDADAGSAQILDCNLTTQTLDGSLSSQGSIYTYLWSTIDGNIVNQVNTINPEIDAPGTYQILVTNIDNQCTSTAQITVDQQIVAPMVEAGQSDTINCIQSIAQLSGVGSSTGTDFEYLWSSFDGNPITNQTQIDASVAIEGVYQLLVTDNSNGCSDSDIVIITIDTITPVLSGQVPDILNCSVTDAILSINSSVINDVSYDWTTSSGNIISGSTTANPIVDAPGVYELQFVNLVNGCEAQEQITVLQDINQPTIDAGSGGTITCVDLVFNAQATANTNSGQSNISWTTPNGTIDSGAATLNPIFSDQGLYVVEIIDPINDCIDVDTVEVLLNQNYPAISPLSPLTLDCNNVVVTIDGSSTSLEPQYQLQWTTASGNIVSGGTTLTPVVDLAGQYDLTIVDIDNGCESSESVLISSDFDYPDISAGTDVDLPCGVSVTSLQGTINGSTAGLQILWNALSGNIVNGGSTLTPTIDIGGTYAMSVVNTVNGCESLDTVSVMFDAPPVLNYTSTDPLCAGDFGSLNITTVTGGTPPYVYSIDDGDNYSSSADFGFLPAGEYSIVAQDFNGCETDISVVTLTEPPVFDVMVLDSVISYQEGEQAQIVADPSYPLSSITSILWTPSLGLSCVDCLDPIVSTQVSTTYILELINANGCSTSVAIPVFVDKSANVFVANTFTPNSDGVNEVLMIMADVTNVKVVKSFEVYDRWGEKMFGRSNFPPNDPQYGWDGTFNGSLLNQGVFVYYVEVEMLDGRIELLKGDVFLSK